MVADLRCKSTKVLRSHFLRVRGGYTVDLEVVSSYSDSDLVILVDQLSIPGSFIPSSLFFRLSIMMCVLGVDRYDYLLILVFTRRFPRCLP